MLNWCIVRRGFDLYVFFEWKLETVPVSCGWEMLQMDCWLSQSLNSVVN